MPDTNISIRADERMRIVQQLHNSTCQLLAVLQLNLGLKQRGHTPSATHIVDLLDESIRAADSTPKTPLAAR